MANISFKSITFPGLANKYNVPEISNDLMTQGKAADAKATGDALSALEDLVDEETSAIKADLDSLEPGLSDDAKAALLACFRHVARWDDSSGRAYYNNLYTALYPDVIPVSISAAFVQGQAIVYDTDNLVVLRQYLAVTATYSDGTTESVSDYVLSGTLTSGTCTITVEYQTKTATFSVNVSHDDSPDIGTGEIIQGYYFDASGNEVQSNLAAIVNRTYYPISPNTKYIWTQGLMGNNYQSSGYSGMCNVYRICYYDSNYNFISRATDPRYSTEWEYIEPRYFEFTTPSNAAYIRISCTYLPVGKITRKTPSYLYAVTMLLTNPDDSQINTFEEIIEKISVYRNNENITSAVLRNGKNIDYSADNTVYFRRSAFNANNGGTPEAGNQTESQTRIFNNKSFILEYGDVIKFNNVKYGVRCENIADGTVLHTSAWVTDNSDYIVGV